MPKALHTAWFCLLFASKRMCSQALGKKKSKCPDSCHVSSFDLEATGQGYFLLIFGGVWVFGQNTVSGQWRDSVVGSGLLMRVGPCRGKMSHLKSTLSSFLVILFGKCDLGRCALSSCWMSHSCRPRTLSLSLHPTPTRHTKGTEDQDYNSPGWWFLNCFSGLLGQGEC